MESGHEVFHEQVREDTVLEKMGYQQKLKRSFGLLGMIGFSFNIVTCWTALGSVLIVGVNSGGPPVMIWSWLGICVVTLAVAYSLAEICSAYPTAGGQYSWVAILAPPKIARGLSWVTGWFMITGVLAMGATSNFIGANFVLGQANLANPNYTIERWHTVLVAYLIALLATVVNIYGPQLLDKLSRGMLIWNISSFVIIIVVLLATNDHKQTARFVFRDFQNFSGFGTAYCAILGLLQSAFGMCCYESPAHMTEETKNASKEAPKAILMTVYIGFITGFIFLITLCLCIGNIEKTALTPTGVPLIQIFYDSTNSVVGSCFLSSLVTVIVLVCSSGMIATGSRSVYAFARDHGLPFSNVFSRVEPKKQVPIYAILLTAASQVALNSIYLGTTNGFNTIISISTEGFYLSYAMPLLMRIITRFNGQGQELHGPFRLSPTTGLTLNIIGVVFLLFASITFNFPTLNPVTSDNMNYTSAAIGIIGLISLVTWITTGRERFTGPELTLHATGSDVATIDKVMEQKLAVHVAPEKL
ncbi:MAG: hypothetical protein M1836_003429 [Candelina mexicana]|nr:MAG: hypothetical protein M1836_003429 [Candelina mexicana]